MKNIYRTINVPSLHVNLGVFHCIDGNLDVFTLPGFNVAGLQYGFECWCGGGLYSKAEKQATARCDQPCPGDKEQTCGGYLQMDVFKTGFGSE